MDFAPDSASLYLTEGTSDKEYHAQLAPDPKGTGAWVVNYQHGRRGDPLKGGTKTPAPLAFAAARKAFDELVASKTKKGYTPAQSGQAYQDTEAGEQFTGLIPQLPQVVRDPAHVDQMMASPEYVLQEKFDGENRQVQVKDGSALGINKRGMAVALPQALADQALSLGMDFLASAEEVDGVLHLFDIQEMAGKDLRARPYSLRLQRLRDLLTGHDVPGLMVVETRHGTVEKQALMDAVRERGGEGVVFKRLDAPFVPGKRPAGQSDTFKLKFVEDCTVRVAGVSATKRSVAVETDHAGQPLPLGKVSVPANHDLPAPGDLVSVSYLYLHEGGSLFQPQYKGPRTDCEGPDALEAFKVKPKQPAPRKPAAPQGR